MTYCFDILAKYNVFFFPIWTSGFSSNLKMAMNIYTTDLDMGFHRAAGRQKMHVCNAQN